MIPLDWKEQSPAIATRLVAIATGVEATATRLEAMAGRLEAITSRLEAVASRLERTITRVRSLQVSWYCIHGCFFLIQGWEIGSSNCSPFLSS